MISLKRALKFPANLFAVFPSAENKKIMIYTVFIIELIVKS